MVKEDEITGTCRLPKFNYFFEGQLKLELFTNLLS
jgi:hypothetical protein